jgi:3-phosphoshikimate 1-carboxyvinyltransferase
MRMKYYTVNPSKLQGTMTASPSKSHTLRAILFASMADGVSSIKNVLDSPDTEAMIRACTALGAHVKYDKSTLAITGIAGKPCVPDDVIDAGNSGQVLRFVAAIAALLDGHVVLTGDKSVRFNRPVKPLMDGLRGLGATCISTKNDDHAPLIIKGPITPGHTVLNGEDSQPVSGMLIASAFLPGKTTIQVNNPGEKPWVALTLAWFDKLGITYTHQNFEHYVVDGYARIQNFNYTVPGDFSSLAYPLVAALITGSQITMNTIDMTDAQGDKHIIEVLKSMGAHIAYEHHSLTVHTNGPLTGCIIDVNPMIDALPILAVLACYATGTTQLINAGIARKKESDRLATITCELKKMGANITETETSLTIQNTPLTGAVMRAHDDHRIAMALSIAALGASSPSSIQGIACVKKSYPGFLRDMQALGCSMAERS